MVAPYKGSPVLESVMSPETFFWEKTLKARKNDNKKTKLFLLQKFIFNNKKQE